MIQLTDEERLTRDLLIKYASKGSVVTYGKLIKEARLNLDMSIPYDRGLLGKILGTISVFEHYEKRPLLSSVAVTANFQHSDGFYKVAEILGFGDKELLKSKDWAMSELNRTHKYWKSNKQ